MSTMDAFNCSNCNLKYETKVDDHNVVGAAAANTTQFENCSTISKLYRQKEETQYNSFSRPKMKQKKASPMACLLLEVFPPFDPSLQNSGVDGQQQLQFYYYCYSIESFLLFGRKKIYERFSAIPIRRMNTIALFVLAFRAFAIWKVQWQ